jgi:hypothetical protein
VVNACFGGRYFSVKESGDTLVFRASFHNPNSNQVMTVRDFIMPQGAVKCDNPPFMEKGRRVQIGAGGVAYQCQRLDWSRPLTFILKNDVGDMTDGVSKEQLEPQDWKAFRYGSGNSPQYFCALPDGPSSAALLKAGATPDFNCNESVSCGDATLRKMHCRLLKGSQSRWRATVREFLKTDWQGVPAEDKKGFGCRERAGPIEHSVRLPCNSPAGAKVCEKPTAMAVRCAAAAKRP